MAKRSKISKNTNQRELFNTTINNKGYFDKGTNKGLTNNNSKINKQSLKILHNMGHKNSFKELMSILNHTSENKFRANYLKPLLELGFIHIDDAEYFDKIVIKNNPGHKTQRYCVLRKVHKDIKNDYGTLKKIVMMEKVTKKTLRPKKDQTYSLTNKFIKPNMNLLTNT